MGRIIGDTAIIVILLGASLKNEGAGGTPVLGTLRGTGSTLTSYVYNNSPAGEGNAPQKAYAAGVRAADDRARAERARHPAERSGRPAAAGDRRCRL